jgi:EAL domain-containing protein (putative c-di-GMP-specific phosphodiesterase class I)
VEMGEQKALLRILGVDYIQGNLQKKKQNFKRDTDGKRQMRKQNLQHKKIRTQVA